MRLGVWWRLLAGAGAGVFAAGMAAAVAWGVQGVAIVVVTAGAAGWWLAHLRWGPRPQHPPTGLPGRVILRGYASDGAVFVGPVSLADLALIAYYGQRPGTESSMLHIGRGDGPILAETPAGIDITLTLEGER